MRLVIAEVEILVICTGIYLGNIAISLLGAGAIHHNGARYSEVLL